MSAPKFRFACRRAEGWRDPLPGVVLAPAAIGDDPAAPATLSPVMQESDVPSRLPVGAILHVGTMGRVSRCPFARARACAAAQTTPGSKQDLALPSLPALLPFAACDAPVPANSVSLQSGCVGLRTTNARPSDQHSPRSRSLRCAPAGVSAHYTTATGTHAHACYWSGTPGAQAASFSPPLRRAQVPACQPTALAQSQGARGNSAHASVPRRQGALPCAGSRAQAARWAARRAWPGACEAPENGRNAPPSGPRAAKFWWHIIAGTRCVALHRRMPPSCSCTYASPRLVRR